MTLRGVDRLALKTRVPSIRRRRLVTSPGRLLFYGLALAFVTLGVIMGALSVNMMSPQASLEMVDLLEGAIHVWQVPGYSPPRIDIFQQSASLHLKVGAVLWAAGLTVLGLPVVVLVLFMRGFSLGFTAGALIFRHGLSGLGLGLAALFPPNMFLLPALCLLGGQSFFYALGKHVERPERPLGTRFSGSAGLVRHLVVGAVAGVLLLAGTAVEGYLVPIFLRWLAPLFG